VIRFPLVLVAIAVVCWLAGWPLGIDSAVYRAGAQAVWHGQPLYAALPGLPDWAPPLPFTYPPISAIGFLTLAALPVQLAWGLVSVASTGALAVVSRLCDAPRSVLVLPAMLLLEPVWRTIGFGQINLVLMALVLVDVLGTHRHRGLLIGLAAAVKLTPLIFVLHLLVVGRRADAARAVGAFVGLHAVGALLLPADTVRFWTSALMGGNSATSNGWFGNQSLNGMVQRLTGEADWAFGLALALCAVTVVVAMILVRRTSDPLDALLITAFCGLLVSPISWTHHWVWVVPLLLVLARRDVRFAVPVALVFTGAQVLLEASAYVLVGCAVAGLSMTWRSRLVTRYGKSRAHSSDSSSPCVEAVGRQLSNADSDTGEEEVSDVRHVSLLRRRGPRPARCRRATPAGRCVSPPGACCARRAAPSDPR